MKFIKLLSLKSLIALGFAVVIIPFFMGVIYATHGLRETSTLNRSVNSQIFEQTKTIQLVLQKASDIERKARLFVLLSDPALRQPYERESYESARASFKQSLSDLLNLHVDNKIALLVNELSEKENLIYQQIIGSETDDSFKLPIDEAFLGLRESSNTLSRQFDEHVERTFNELHNQAESLEYDWLITGTILLIISCGLALSLLTVLSRSMRQLQTSVLNLGSSDLHEPIEIRGPYDVRRLGEHLEWLRTHLSNLETSKQLLTQNLAREVARPLQAIRKGCALLSGFEQSTFAPDADADADAIQAMTSSVDRLQTVSEQLSKYSQFQVVPSLAKQQNLDVQDLLELVIENFQLDYAAKSICIKKQLDPIFMQGVADQMHDIFEQLLSNAIKFSPENGEIRIMLREAGDYMELEIEDDGPGVEPEYRSQVFEPFFRANTPNNELSDNPGLGLVMVREYVAHHHGMVEFIAPQPNHHGAHIRLRLPLENEI